MPVEAATTIPTLDANNPLSTDPISDGDNHIRMLKTILKYHFPNLHGQVTSGDTDLNLLAGISGAGLTTNDIRLLQGAYNAGVRTGDINKLSGITGNIQALLNGKAPLNGAGVGGTWTINITGRGFPKRSDGNDLNFTLGGYAQNPQYVLGCYVETNGLIQNINAFSPGSLNVNYAAFAGNASTAESATNAHYATNAGYAASAGDLTAITNTNVIMHANAVQAVGAYGTYALMRRINHNNAAFPNDMDTGSNLVYSDAAGNSNGWNGVGTWKTYGYRSSVASGAGAVTLMMRVA